MLVKFNAAGRHHRAGKLEVAHTSQAARPRFISERFDNFDTSGFGM